MSSLTQIEALAALLQYGTMTRAAAALRLTQSAVSKRIAGLEDELGVALVERQGRRAVLTATAIGIVERAAPLLAELKAALRAPASEARGELSLGVAESVVASWGSAVVYAAEARVPGLGLVLHSHRGPVVAERVAAGEYALGLVAGAPAGEGLELRELAREPLVVIPSGTGVGPHDARAGRTARPKELAVITIEERSATWAAVARRALKERVRVDRRVESFFAAARLGMAGFGHALVPLGVADTLGIKRGRLWRFAAGALERPVVVVGRRSTFARALVAALVEELEATLAPVAKGWRR